MTYLVEVELQGEKLSRNEILDICFLFLLAGLDTITATLGCNIAYLAANPEQRRRLIGNPSQIEGVVEELLRWETPVTGVPRVLKRDVTLGGIELKQGELVTLLLGASNVDDQEFGNADAVDFDRERNRHLAPGLFMKLVARAARVLQFRGPRTGVDRRRTFSTSRIEAGRRSRNCSAIDVRSRALMNNPG